MKFYKILPAVSHTINHLVQGINGEMWKRALQAYGFKYLVTTFTCFSVLNGWSVDPLTLSLNNNCKWLNGIQNCHIFCFKKSYAEDMRRAI